MRRDTGAPMMANNGVINMFLFVYLSRFVSLNSPSCLQIFFVHGPIIFSQFYQSSGFSFCFCFFECVILVILCSLLCLFWLFYVLCCVYFGYFMFFVVSVFPLQSLSMWYIYFFFTSRILAPLIILLKQTLSILYCYCFILLRILFVQI